MGSTVDDSAELLGSSEDMKREVRVRTNAVLDPTTATPDGVEKASVDKASDRATATRRAYLETDMMGFRFGMG